MRSHWEDSADKHIAFFSSEIIDSGKKIVTH